MNEKTLPLSCDWTPGGRREEKKAPSPSPAGGGPSRLHRFAGSVWEDVEPERYKAEDGAWAAIVRHTLIGNRGENARFDLRYFEIAPGGYSSLEKHVHEHVVVCVRGKGQILLGGEVREIGFLDTAYIAPDDPHQLINPFDEPFGFLCIVDHERDRPRPLDDSDLASLLASPVAPHIRP